MYSLFGVEKAHDAFRDAGILSTCKDNKGIEYYNEPISFDIETTSYNDGEHMRGFMYIWTFAIRETIIQGRTWESFVQLCEQIQKWYGLYEEKRMVIYVHNLSFEFQFMHKWFKWLEVFSLKKRQPVRALTDLGIEFRCSYKLSGYSLAKLSEQLTKYKVKKMVGDLDYSKIRNKDTVLTEAELGYCINDCLVVNSYIKEYIERVGHIFDLPMTKTGEVRNFTRRWCFYDGGKKDKYKKLKYMKLMQQLQLDSESYLQINRAFQGGYTHANPLYSGEVVYNVHSKDFTSSYPYVMISERFPMSKPQLIEDLTEEMFEKYLEEYACVFDVTFHNLEDTFLYDNYISKSHSHGKGIESNNGRVVRAEELTTTITEIDFEIINMTYSWESIEIFNFRVMKKDYLPKNFVMAILQLYENKTTLKGVIGKEVEYLQSKERINSMFGMCVTDICRDKIIYNSDDWIEEKPDVEQAVLKNNSSKRRFLYYPWGVWVTAYARKNLWSAILNLGKDYIYCDTDSVKYINEEEHKDYFEQYNEIVIDKLKWSMSLYGIPFERTCPKNKKGKSIQIGVWDDEGTYTRFKTLGAKRYMVEKKNAWLYKKNEWTFGDIDANEVIIDGEEFYSLDFNITVSGLNKGVCVPYLHSLYGDKVFENFKDGLYIPKEYTGKMTHFYDDEEIESTITDYQGNKSSYHEKSSIGLYGADYSLSIDQDYLLFLMGLLEEDVQY